MRTLAAITLVLVVAGMGLLVVRSQQSANRMIVARLEEVRDALREQTLRNSELSGQVATLSERVGRLEADNRDLRRQLAALLKRKPAQVAAIALPPLTAMPLMPIAEPSIASAERFVLEPVAITWSTDWSSYQPAGIIAPAPGLVLRRRLTDPDFVRKLYYGYAALQFTDAMTTLVSVDRGAREANPLLQQAARNPAAMIGLKAAAVAGTILTVEKIRQDHPIVATATLIAINATLAVVAVNNVSVAARQQTP
jgi:hypothetical protein